MRNSVLLFLVTFVAMATITNAQNSVIVNRGCIDFERKINNYAVLPQLFERFNRSAGESQRIMRDYRATNQQFKTDQFHLYFDSSKTYYEPTDPAMYFLYGLYFEVAHKNKVFTDFSKSTILREQQAMEQQLFCMDSISKINWKFTGETREILGYECYRANAIIMDSVYVVAFYTDAIKTAGGPEAFSGLPGMILGVALPHYHITYFATKIENYDATGNNKEVPVRQGKNKMIKKQEFVDLVTKMLNKYGSGAAWLEVFIGL